MDKNYMIKFCFLKKFRFLNCKIIKLKYDLNILILWVFC